MNNGKKKMLFVALLVAGAVATSYLARGEVRQEQTKPVRVVQPVVQKQESKIQVYVSGAVLQPGIYELKKGTRAAEAVQAAGGLREDADGDRVNLAKKLQDGAHVYVPTRKSKSSSGRASSGSAVKASESNKAGQNAVKVNINTADGAELMRVPGIGSAMANRILALRRVRNFSQLEDLLQVRGIGKAKLEQLRPYLYVQ